MSTALQTPTSTLDQPSVQDAYRVLIVEGDHNQARFAQSIIQSAGMQTQWVADIRHLAPALDSFLPDLVLAELQLPDGNGIQLISQVRSDQRHTHLPIVFLTNNFDPEIRFNALSQGADDVLFKPVRPRHLTAALQNRIMRARAMHAATLPVMPSATVDSSTADSGTPWLPREQALTELPTAASAMLLEIQHFPVLRSQLGLIGVESVMQAAANRIASVHPRITRLGDDVFLLLAPPPDSATAQQLREVIGEPIEFTQFPIRLEARVGVVDITTTAPEDPMRALELALRDARGTESGIAFYRPTPKHVDSRVESIRLALHENNGLELAYQPIVAVGGGALVQFQVLLRMREAEGQRHYAAELIASARGAGLLVGLDAWVLDTATEVLENQHQGGHPVRLFVSQSPEALAADPHAERLHALVTRHNIPEGALVIDLRLDDAILHTLTMRDFCNAASSFGVRFCLSRYQHGEEAKALLKQLPLHYLRLAPAEHEAGTNAQAQLRNSIADAHDAGLEAIGGQVDNPVAASALWTCGVDYIQGNLIHAESQTIDSDFQQPAI